MAAVVTTTTINFSNVFGSKRVVGATLAFDTGDYAAGGVAVTPGQFGLVNIDAVLFQGVGLEVSATPTANVPQWVPATSKIRFFQGAGAGDPLPEKGVEAFGAGANIAVIVIGH
jgi:hypothetical protein